MQTTGGENESVEEIDEGVTGSNVRRRLSATSSTKCVWFCKLRRKILFQHMMAAVAALCAAFDSSRQGSSSLTSTASSGLLLKPEVSSWTPWPSLSGVSFSIVEPSRYRSALRGASGPCGGGSAQRTEMMQLWFENVDNLLSDYSV